MNTSHTNPIQCPSWVRSSLVSRAAMGLLTLCIVASSAMAQTVTMRSQPLRFTIPKGVASSNAVVLTIPVSGLVNPGVDTINLAVTGLPGSGNAAAFLSTNGLTSNITYTATLILTNDASIVAGDYDLAVVASGAASFRLPVPVQVAAIWSGSNFTNSVSTNWTSAGNWIGGAVPGPTDTVVFKDISGMANANTTNVIIAADATISSLRFSPEGGSTRFNSVEIQDGRKLSITGAGLSFSLHRDTKGAGQRIDTFFSGGGTLEVINPSAEIGVLVDNQQNATLDMRNLNNFTADVKRIGLGNWRIWPNVETNGYTGQGAGIQNIPWRYVPLVWLAKTNVIKCNWVDPNNYNDGGVRDYAIEVGNDTASGTTTAIRFSLGLHNTFEIDSIVWSHSGKGASGNNYNFHTSDSYASFRGIGGGNNRVSVWAQGDASGIDSSGSNTRGNTCDFSGGAVDARIDRLLLARSRTNTSGMTIQATLTIGGNYPGTIFDVNTAILGHQDFDNLNATAATVSGPSATVNVNSNATLKVNGDLHLGYTVAAAVGAPTFPENCAGTLNINQSGTVMASNVLAGGVTKLSVNNNISVNNGGKLIVTNRIGASDARINNLTLANNAQLTLLGTAVGQTKVHVTTLSAATACNISVPAIAGYTSGDVTISLISYVTASPVISGLAITPPAGLFIKSIVDNSGTQTIDVTFTDRPPLVLVWRGNINNIWDNATKNWVTQIGGFQTNFVDGDSVIFDDTATGSTSIDVAGSVAPGQTAATYGIVVNNTTKSYTINSGSVIGSATLQKTGVGSLTVNATMSPGVLLSQGSLAGVGTVGPTSLGDGTTMTGFSGTITGGLSASNATVTVTGSVNGGLNLRAGSLANMGTINGSVTVATNVTLNNTLTGNLNVILPWSVPTNSTLINNGTIRHSGSPGGNQGLTVNGSLSGRGIISSHGTNSIADVRVTLGAGGSLNIGNAANEITNMTIAVRLDLLANSTSTFDVNTTTTSNDRILLTEGFNVGKVNFGAGNSAGGTLVVNKAAGPAFNLGTTLYLFDLTSNFPDNANQAIPGVTPAPAPGLTWNVSQMVTNLTLLVAGQPQLTNSITVATNGVKSFVFDWPESYRGWRLERQTNTLAVGLELNSTNWTTVATSLGGTNSTFTDTNTGAVYFRSIQAVTDTNSVGLSPATFFRLNYP